MPDRAASLRDFWRGVHMGLSLFRRDYLDVAMGGNRRGLPGQGGALAAAVTLGGLWHGAGLTFLAWGALHGIGLGAGVLARRARIAIPAPPGRAPTSLVVLLAWVPVRATSFAAPPVMFTGLPGLAP